MHEEFYFLLSKVKIEKNIGKKTNRLLSVARSKLTNMGKKKYDDDADDDDDDDDDRDLKGPCSIMNAYSAPHREKNRLHNVLLMSLVWLCICDILESVAATLSATVTVSDR
jgi:hypothetical protein